MRRQRKSISGWGDVLRSVGDNIRPSGGAIKAGGQVIVNEEGPVLYGKFNNDPHIKFQKVPQGDP